MESEDSKKSRIFNQAQIDADESFKKSQVDSVFCMVTNLLQAAEQPEDQAQPDIYGILTGLHVCDICGKEYANISNLNRHLKKIHKEDVLSVRAKIKCPLCEFGCEFYASLCKHLEEEHSIIIERENLVFRSEEDFFTWKKKIEKDTKASFIKKCGRKKAKNNRIEKMYFYCHRSGEKLKRPTLGKRQMKAQGSCKMNSGCPAQITVVKYNVEEGKLPVLEVEFLKTHVGHSMDMRHIRLDYEEKVKLASQLADGVPIDRVLDTVKKPTELNGPTERIHLTTRKDLLNITKQFNIRTKHSNWDQDVNCIDSWVRQVHGEGNDNSPILCYKPGGEMCDDFPTLAPEDFLLGIMNSFQMELLKRYGSHLICVDRTHLSNGFDFPLVTVMVLDEAFQAFPAVYFISNKQDENVMGVFFEQIKNKIQPQKLKPKVFLTDTARVFYNAWKHVMGAVEEKRFCPWHVEAIWQKKVQLIKDIEEQHNVYKALNILLEEPEPMTFQETLNALLCDWQMDERLKRFARYFQQHFASFATFWSTCHRKVLSTEASKSLEKLHKRIKSSYFEDCMKVKCMDRAIESIMTLLNELEQRQNSRDVELDVLDEKMLSLIIERHEKSLQINPNNIISVDTDAPPIYLVPSLSKEQQMYVVHVITDICQCSLKCPHCNVCTHKFKCTCKDYLEKNNICQHIHAAFTKMQSHPASDTIVTPDVEQSLEEILVQGSEEVLGKCSIDGQHQQVMMLANDQDLLHIATASDNSSVMAGDILESESPEEQILIRVFSSGNIASSSFTQEKKVLEDKAEQLLSKIKTCSSWDELNTIKNALIPLEPAMEMVVNGTETEDAVMVDANNLQTFIVTEKAC